MQHGRAHSVEEGERQQAMQQAYRQERLQRHQQWQQQQDAQQQQMQQLQQQQMQQPQQKQMQQPQQQQPQHQLQQQQQQQPLPQWQQQQQQQQEQRQRPQPERQWKQQQWQGTSIAGTGMGTGTGVGTGAAAGAGIGAGMTGEGAEGVAGGVVAAGGAAAGPVISLAHPEDFLGEPEETPEEALESAERKAKAAAAAAAAEKGGEGGGGGEGEEGGAGGAGGGSGGEGAGEEMMGGGGMGEGEDEEDRMLLRGEFLKARKESEPQPHRGVPAAAAAAGATAGAAGGGAAGAAGAGGGGGANGATGAGRLATGGGVGGGVGVDTGAASGLTTAVGAGSGFSTTRASGVYGGAGGGTYGKGPEEVVSGGGGIIAAVSGTGTGTGVEEAVERAGAAAGVGAAVGTGAAGVSEGGLQAAAVQGEGEGEVEVPVVVIVLKPRVGKCAPGTALHRVLQQARQRNSRVHLVGPRECAPAASAMGVAFSRYSLYKDTISAFRSAFGAPRTDLVRWFVLHAFMHRNDLSHALHLSPDVLLFANATEAVNQLYLPHERHILLPLPFPGTRHPRRATLPPHTPVEGHTAGWSREGLADFLRFVRAFVERGVLEGGEGTRTERMKNPDYSDATMLGWYARQACWHAPESPEASPACAAEPCCGITRERAARLAGQFTPRFNVSSLLQPRRCRATPWSDDGWCVFSVYPFSPSASDTSASGGPFQPAQRLSFHSKLGMKTPRSAKYRYFALWKPRGGEGEVVKSPGPNGVQFLSVRFAGEAASQISADPETTWGAADWSNAKLLGLSQLGAEAVERMRYKYL
ncbi:hypothetical protein CLOP_g6362 [Closterium sp. NIES-67]|nr:hypothetical protein CLOP_g6362 [Closterium sp. NIES-67]